MSESIQVHPAANIFPMMGAAAFKELKADIEKHGQKEPIIYYRGLLLDGRNREKACRELGIRPSECELDENEDPLAYVLSANLHRRHLNESQRAMIGAEAARQLSAAAAERMKAGKVADPSAPVRQGKAAAEAATGVGVSTRTVEKAIKVANNAAPEVVAAVRDGKITVSAAERLVHHIPKPQQQAGIIVRSVQFSKTALNDQAIQQAVQTKLRRRATAVMKEKAGCGLAAHANPVEVLSAPNGPPDHAKDTLIGALERLHRGIVRIYGEWPKDGRSVLADKLREYADELDAKGELVGMEGT